MKEFEPASCSRKVRRWTAALLVLLGLLVALGVVPGLCCGSRVAGMLAIVSGVLIVLLVVLAWAASPGSYIVNDDGVIIRLRRWKEIRIACEHITDVARAGFSDVFDQATIVHNQAYLFSATGTYWSPRLNDFECYCTSQDDLVVIRRKTGRPVVISPRDPAGFVEVAGSLIRNEGQDER